MGDTNNRLKAFKNKGKDPEEMRRRRAGDIIELRKMKKEDQLLKKRNITSNEEINEPQMDQASPGMSPNEIIVGLMSSDEVEQLAAIQACRKVVSRERNPPIDQMIRLGVVPRCVHFLTKHHNNELQFQACWTLTNIASGTSEQTAAVVQEGALPKLKDLLKSPNFKVLEQAIWALGNIAGDGPDYRDLVLNLGCLPEILDLFRGKMPLSLLHNAVWTVSNLCRLGSRPPNFDMVRIALPVLSNILDSNASEILVDACWALSYLSDGRNENIQAVINAGITKKLIRLLYSEEHTYVIPALRTVGNIVTGTDEQTDVAINAGLLEALAVLLQQQRVRIVKEATWTVSNIAAGTTQQIHKIFEAGIMPHIIHILQTGDFKCQKEAVWTIANCSSEGTAEHANLLVEMGVIKPLCNLLNSKDTKTVQVVLNGITNILTLSMKSGNHEKVAILIEECGGLDAIESLQNHDNEKIYKNSLDIVERFFSEENVNEETEEQAPVVEKNLWYKTKSAQQKQQFSF